MKEGESAYEGDGNGRGEWSTKEDSNNYFFFFFFVFSNIYSINFQHN